MAPTGERLAVSVIEARNVAADFSIEPQFYVKLRVGPCVAVTNKTSGTITPNFMTDVRLELHDGTSDIIQVELLQAGPRGDLVLGGAEVPVGELVGNGTLLHWLELVNSAGQLGAELFVVLRHSTGSPSRPLSPLVRAHLPVEEQAAVQQLPMAQSLFPSKKQLQASSSAVEADAYDGHGKQAGKQPGKQQKQAGYTQQQQQDGMSPQPREMLRSELSVSEASAAAATAAAGEVSAAARSSGSIASKRSRRGRRLKLPLPLVLAGGALLGAAGYMLNVKPRYVEVPDNEAMCTVGICNSRQLAVLQQVDDLEDLAAPIYVGDRLRIH